MNGARRFNLTGVLAVVCVSWTGPVFAGQQTTRAEERIKNDVLGNLAVSQEGVCGHAMS